eukprot:TRINITY_DN584_c0_g1_i1.p1 TRINITY_DN584_c0_g1~~TRINITY_DN584_c0_g1_i1.p1  ORF type:complete len:238 (-),score=78.59 TRINITY_DN584_c0_g1_i1:357-986(-)
MAITIVTNMLVMLVMTQLHLTHGQDTTCQDLDSLDIDSWHLHYVYNDSSEATADTFTERFVEQFRDYFPCRGHSLLYSVPTMVDRLYRIFVFLGGGKGPDGGAHGPWDDPEYGFFIPLKYVTETLGWATINRAGLSLMFHINTGCMADDHTIRAFWAGEKRLMYPENLPCNTPGTGCAMKDPNCGCSLPLPGGVEDTCENCAPNGGDGR